MSTITCPAAETARSAAATYDVPRREVPQLGGMRQEHPPDGIAAGITGTSQAPHPSATSAWHLPARA